MLKLIRFCYWLDDHWPKPARWADRLYTWLEVRGKCCEVHKKKVDI